MEALVVEVWACSRCQGAELEGGVSLLYSKEQWIGGRWAGPDQGPGLGFGPTNCERAGGLDNVGPLGSQGGPGCQGARDACCRDDFHFTL